MMLAPGLDAENSEKGKLKKGLKLDKEQLDGFKIKFKWVKPEV